jgi:hypothetical protein
MGAKAVNMHFKSWQASWFALSLIAPLVLMLLAWQGLLLPGLAKVAQMQQTRDQLRSNVYESDWLDSAQARLEGKLVEADRALAHGLGRLLPERPFQQTLDSLRYHAGQCGIEILETQVATSKRDSLRTMLLKVHARGSYAAYWKWLKALESRQPWWSVQDWVLKPVGESNQVLDGSMVLSASGKEEVLP